jgi:hypothetical protein
VKVWQPSILLPSHFLDGDLVYPIPMPEKMHPSSVFFTLGPPRRGELFETTAVPEIRVQAEALALHLAREPAIEAFTR